MAEIIVPSGSQGAYIEKLSGIPGQEEFLLPRGTEFRIVSKEVTDFGDVELVVEVVP